MWCCSIHYHQQLTRKAQPIKQSFPNSEGRKLPCVSAVLIQGTYCQWSWWLAVAWSCICCFIPRSGDSKPHNLLSRVNKLSASITRFLGGVNILEYILVNFKDTNHVLECFAVQFSSYMELKLIKVMKPSCVYRWLSWSRVEKTFLWPALTELHTSTWWQTTG